MLVEDYNVLHRDISWGNVLINATHVDEDQPDDLCDRPFIDMINYVKYVSQCLHFHARPEIMFDTGRKQDRSMLCYLISIARVFLKIVRCASQLLEVKLL